jgi:hypothetical protein
MEDNFLPPPSLMAGGDMSQKGGGFDIAALSVIHCHEGEVKVQLNSEYALTVNLVDSKNSREMESASTNATNTANASASHSGSQTKEEIHVLCRLLLLHAQFVFHDHHKRSGRRDRDAADDMSESKKVDYSLGILQSATNIRRNMLARKKMAEESPSILQSCVALGGKVLFERQVRLVLEVRISDAECSDVMISFMKYYYRIRQTHGISCFYFLMTAPDIMAREKCSFHQISS